MSDEALFDDIKAALLPLEPRARSKRKECADCGVDWPEGWEYPRHFYDCTFAILNTLPGRMATEEAR